MGFKPVVRAELLKTLNQRVFKRKCPLCVSEPQWTLAEGFIWLGLQENLEFIGVGGPGLPCVAIVCRNCGNTQLLNLKQLELEHLAYTQMGS